jgi:hypothetical protein
VHTVASVLTDAVTAVVPSCAGAQLKVVLERSMSGRSNTPIPAVMKQTALLFFLTSPKLYKLLRKDFPDEPSEAVLIAEKTRYSCYHVCTDRLDFMSVLYLLCYCLDLVLHGLGQAQARFLR